MHPAGENRAKNPPKPKIGISQLGDTRLTKIGFENWSPNFEISKYSNIGRFWSILGDFPNFQIHKTADFAHFQNVFDPEMTEKVEIAEKSQKIIFRN